jgi:glutamate transport system permease protein
MSNESVLYDAPGPRARRTTLIVSIVAAVLAVVGAYFLIYKPLKANGQLSMELWGPLIDPGNENFEQLWKRLGQGFKATIIAAVLAIICSLLFGTALAILRVQLRSVHTVPGVQILISVLNWITRICVEVFRGIPVVITIFFVWVGLNQLGAKDVTIPLSRIGLDDLTISYLLYSLVIGLTIYNGVVIGEILRSGMEGLPRGQREAADAIGLSTFQTIRLVLLPQAYRIMLPALISQLVVVLKDTSLGFIITYEEILRVAGQTVQVLGNGIQTYVVIGAIYITVNYALSKLAEYTQRRMARGRKAPRQPGGAIAQPPASLGADTELPPVPMKVED